jgi:hypothetical protein
MGTMMVANVIGEMMMYVIRVLPWVGEVEE